MTIRIGNGAGFWGDDLDAPVRLAETGELDCLTLEYLAELTMSILARQRRKNPQAGFVGDFPNTVGRLAGCLQRQPNLTVVTNAGGMNPKSCAAAVGRTLVEAGLGELKVAAVFGDDVLERIPTWLEQGVRLENLDDGRPLAELGRPVVSANVYLGAGGLVEALARDARVVVSGRVADASLTLAPALHRFGWSWDDWARLAGASAAGHLIECGAQVTGGLNHDWRRLNLTEVGYPIAEIEADGSSVLTKPMKSGGVVTRRTVIEQMLYEIGDPAQYLTPDVVVDFTTAEVHDLGNDRVQVRNVAGRAKPDQLKVSLAYDDGFTASGQMLVYGPDCLAKAEACAAMILHRTARAGFPLLESHVECLGAGAGVPGLHAPPSDLREVLLRVTVRDPRREAVERFTREWAPLVTSGPPGLAGYAAGLSPVRPAFAYWPTLIPRDWVQPQVEVQSALAWSRIAEG